MVGRARFSLVWSPCMSGTWISDVARAQTGVRFPANSVDNYFACRCIRPRYNDQMQNDTDSPLTPDRVSELLSYNPETGTFCKLSSGKNVGCKNKDGYVLITIDGRLYRAHRVAWLLVHGEWPQGVLDHINRDRADNRIYNLRDSTRSENTQNSTVVRAACGLRGVSRNGKRWRSAIALDGVDYYLGTFDTPEEAHAAYLAAASKKHPRSPITKS